MTEQFVEWMAAIVLIALIALVMLALATIISGGAVLLLVALVIGAGVDVLMAPFCWLSSLTRRGNRDGEERRED